MGLGYACINESLKGKFRTCRIQTFRTEGEEKIKELTNVWKTWEGIEWIPKVHISTGKTSKTNRSHHDYISEEDFNALINFIDKQDVDIMFESKKKDLSVLPFIKKRRKGDDLL